MSIDRSGILTFTIISAFRNQTKYMGDWIKSIIRQEYRPLQVVLIDDTSTENYAPILEEAKKRFAKHNIDFVFQKSAERLHCAGSYSLALSLSTGQFIGVLDADDMLKPGAVQYVMDLYKHHKDVDFIYTQFDVCGKDMKRLQIGFSSRPFKGQSLLDSETREGKRHCFSHWRTFSRIPQIESIFKTGMTSSVDKYMGYRLEEIGKGMFADKVCYLYRTGVKGSITRQGKQMKSWNDVRREAKKRRSDQNIKCVPIIYVKK